MLTPLGVDEISFPKSFGRLHYDNFYKEHPEFQRRAPQQTNTPSTPTPQNKQESIQNNESVSDKNTDRATLQANNAIAQTLNKNRARD